MTDARTASLTSVRRGSGLSFPLSAVSLIDRRTGTAHRIGGAALTLFTRSPQEAVEDLLRDRDPRVWEARIQALPQSEGRA